MLTAVIVYMSILVLVGAWRSRRVKTGDDFLVAGRTLPARVLVFTLLATWVGSGSLFGGAGLGYRSGFSALWQSAGAWVGIALVYFIAPLAGLHYYLLTKADKIKPLIYLSIILILIFLRVIIYFSKKDFSPR